jgi:hypothetical protein
VALEYPFLNAPSGFSYAYFMVIIRITDHTTNCLRIYLYTKIQITSVVVESWDYDTFFRSKYRLQHGLYGICIIEIDSSCIKKPTELKGDSLYQLRSPMAEGGEP